MVIEETWGIPIGRAVHFFEIQPDVAAAESGFRFGSCRITLTQKEPGTLGRIPFPRTGLHIEGPEREAAVIHRRFLIQFLSAGG